MMKRLLMIGCSLLCISATPSGSGTPLWELNAKAQVLAELKDQDSAKFILMEHKGNLTCGTFTAKNGYGGYSGQTFFIVIDPPEKSLESVFDLRSSEIIFPDDKVLSETIARLCAYIKT